MYFCYLFFLGDDCVDSNLIGIVCFAVECQYLVALLATYNIKTTKICATNHLSWDYFSFSLKVSRSLAFVLYFFVLLWVEQDVREDSVYCLEYKANIKFLWLIFLCPKDKYFFYLLKSNNLWNINFRFVKAVAKLIIRFCLDFRP